MRYYVDLGGRTVEVELGDEGVRVDGRSVEAALAHAEGTPVRGLMVGVETYRLVADRGPRGRWQIHLRGRALELDVVDERTKAIRDMTGPGAGAQGPRPVVAPMPGMVVKVEVVEGDVVQAGQGIVIVEAMKMENELKAAGDGSVAELYVNEGQAVELGARLVRLE